MGKKVEIKLNSSGVVELLHRAGEPCLSIAEAAAEKCGDGYAAEKRTYPERTGAVVKAVTYDAAADNLENNTILKAVMGG